MPTRPQHPGLFVSRRVKMFALEGAQRSPQFTVADLVASVEQFPEQCCQELGPLARLQRPGRVGDGGDLRVGNDNHGRSAHLIRKAGDCRSRNKISRRRYGSVDPVASPGASLTEIREAMVSGENP